MRVVSFLSRRYAVVLFLCLAVPASAFAQGGAQPKKTPSSSAAQQKPASPSGQAGINEQFGTPLATESEQAAGSQAESKENSQEKMVEELKFSPSVQWMAKLLHISPVGGYWLGILLDFGILALLVIIALKKNLPAMFRTRTRTIQRGIEEATRASEDAVRRLGEIESRLAKLDSEIGGLRAAAEQEAVAEEQRIKAAAEEDTRRVVETAEAEIAAAAKLAQRELKAYAADLAVTLAEHRIRVDAGTDQQLVRDFVHQLANAGGPGNGAGKDGK